MKPSGVVLPGESLCKSVRRQDIDYDLEYRIYLLDGTIRFLRSSGHHNPAGEIGEYVGITILGTDLQRARRVASQIRAGRVVINGMTDDPQAPWGGFKYSGFGREYGKYGIEAFLETRAMLDS